MKITTAHRPPLSRRRWAGYTGRTVAALASCALVAAACAHPSAGPGVAGAGTSTSPGSSSGSSSPSGSPSPDAVAFARCMRAHGVTDFPDSGALGRPSPGSDLNPGNPTYKAAWQACRSLWPTRRVDPAQAFAAGLKYSKCMREHGITKFPDPDPHGGPHGGGGFDLRGQGIDLNSPQFQAARQACRQYLGANAKGGAAK